MVQLVQGPAHWFTVPTYWRQHQGCQELVCVVHGLSAVSPGSLWWEVFLSLCGAMKAGLLEMSTGRCLRVQQALLDSGFDFIFKCGKQFVCKGLATSSYG